MMKIEIVEVKNHKFLFLDNYLWMWDIPHEQELQRDIAKQAFGDVLVAGYGFGIVTKFLLENPKVTSVTTVEKYPEVIDKMKEFGPIYGKIIIGDFNNLPEDKKFDCVVGDIWAEIDARFLDNYVKFKNKAQKFVKPNGLILGWGKDYFEYLLEKDFWRDCLNCESDYCEHKIANSLYLTPEEKKQFPKLANQPYGKDCPFLNNKKLCDIHPNRPLDCRLFPFDVYKINGKFFGWFGKLTARFQNKRILNPICKI